MSDREGAAGDRTDPATRARDGAAAQWAAALHDWEIPEEILAAAPESPWGFPPALFPARPAGTEPLPTRPARTGPSVSTQLALEALAGGGRVLDVGCGGGAAGLALAPPASSVSGVDADPRMLSAFAAAAGEAGVDHTEVEGTWPDIAAAVPAADVVVCHHVVYNSDRIGSFVAELTSHARRGVVVELTEVHPSVPLAPLWQRFWGLDRPDGPSAALFVEVVRELGLSPSAHRFERPPRKAGVDRSAYVAFTRRRLCLGPERDAEIDEALDAVEAGATTVVAVAWRT